jgi:FkbM family methyltransferase
MIRAALRKMKRIGRRPLRFDRRRECPTERLGSAYGGYAVCPGRLNESSVVYSFGVGLDVSFDEALIAQYRVMVHAFDPTPRSIAWLESRSNSDHFVFHAWGIADFDGTATFYPPDDPKHVSHTIVPRGRSSGARFQGPVLRLRTTMERLGHDHIDLLKMDVEGAEYSVLRDMLASDIPIGQILVEFHHHDPDIPFMATQEAIDELERAGFAVFHGDPRGYEFSLIHRDLV